MDSRHNAEMRRDPVASDFRAGLEKAATDAGVIRFDAAAYQQRNTLGFEVRFPSDLSYLAAWQKPPEDPNSLYGERWRSALGFLTHAIIEANARARAAGFQELYVESNLFKRFEGKVGSADSRGFKIGPLTDRGVSNQAACVLEDTVAQTIFPLLYLRNTDRLKTAVRLVAQYLIERSFAEDREAFGESDLFKNGLAITATSQARAIANLLNFPTAEFAEFLPENLHRFMPDPLRVKLLPAPESTTDRKIKRLSFSAYGSVYEHIYALDRLGALGTPDQLARYYRTLVEEFMEKHGRDQVLRLMLGQSTRESMRITPDLWVTPKVFPYKNPDDFVPIEMDCALQIIRDETGPRIDLTFDRSQPQGDHPSDEVSRQTPLAELLAESQDYRKACAAMNSAIQTGKHPELPTLITIPIRPYGRMTVAVYIGEEGSEKNLAVRTTLNIAESSNNHVTPNKLELRQQESEGKLSLEREKWITDQFALRRTQFETLVSDTLRERLSEYNSETERLVREELAAAQSRALEVAEQEFEESIQREYRRLLQQYEREVEEETARLLKQWEEACQDARVSVRAEIGREVERRVAVEKEHDEHLKEAAYQAAVRLREERKTAFVDSVSPKAETEQDAIKVLNLLIEVSPETIAGFKEEAEAQLAFLREDGVLSLPKLIELISDQERPEKKKQFEAVSGSVLAAYVQYVLDIYDKLGATSSEVMTLESIKRNMEADLTKGVPEPENILWRRLLTSKDPIRYVLQIQNEVQDLLAIERKVYARDLRPIMNLIYDDGERVGADDRIVRETIEWIRDDFTDARMKVAPYVNSFIRDDLEEQRASILHQALTQICLNHLRMALRDDAAVLFDAFNPDANEQSVTIYSTARSREIIEREVNQEFVVEDRVLELAGARPTQADAQARLNEPSIEQLRNTLASERPTLESIVETGYQQLPGQIRKRIEDEREFRLPTMEAIREELSNRAPTIELLREEAKSLFPSSVDSSVDDSSGQKNRIKSNPDKRGRRRR